MPHKLLIVDDEIILTELLTDHFSSCGYLAYSANNGRDAIDMIHIQPDLILLDINMPDVDGMTLCKQIRKMVVCPILFLTARITEQDKVNGFRSGGDDYITKPFSLHELTARVEAHLRRDARTKIAPELLSSQGLIVNLSERTVTFDNINIPFSKREFDIIEFLLSNANHVFDKEHIYEKIWGFDAEGDSSVIKEHVRKIRTKLYNATEKEYIETVWGMGYKWNR